MKLIHPEIVSALGHIEIHNIKIMQLFMHAKEIAEDSCVGTGNEKYDMLF